MWLATQRGFFSIVKDRTNSDMVMVRARVRGDLENLQCVTGVVSPILITPSADYRFRLVVSRADLSTILLKLGKDTRILNLHAMSPREQRSL
jgi:hypothetical protein